MPKLIPTLAADLRLAARADLCCLARKIGEGTSPLLWSPQLREHRGMNFFAVTVPADQVQTTRRALAALSARVREALPDAARVMVLPGQGLSILDQERRALDLVDFPRELVEEVIHFFGFGPYGLPGSAAPACGVRRVGHRP